MKKYLAIVLLLFITAASAQQQAKAKKLTWDEQLDLIMPPFTEAVNLDGLQQAAIRNILLDQMRQSDALQKEMEFSDDRKREEAILVAEGTDKEIKKLLTPAQADLYDQYKTDLRKGKKPKKKKKK